MIRGRQQTLTITLTVQQARALAILAESGRDALGEGQPECARRALRKLKRAAWPKLPLGAGEK